MPRSEWSPERTVIERVIEALRDVPVLVRRQTDNPLIGKIREALGGQGGIVGGERARYREVASYLRDGQDLVGYDLEYRGILERRKSVLVVPRSYDSRLACFCTLLARAPWRPQDVCVTARPLPLTRYVQDARVYVLPCGYRPRKCSRSQLIKMLLSRYIDPS